MHNELHTIICRPYCTQTAAKNLLMLFTMCLINHIVRVCRAHMQQHAQTVLIVIPAITPCLHGATGVDPEQVTDHSRHVFMDFKLSQIKTISFLTYLLRTFPSNVGPHMAQLADASSSTHAYLP